MNRLHWLCSRLPISMIKYYIFASKAKFNIAVTCKRLKKSSWEKWHKSAFADLMKFSKGTNLIKLRIVGLLTLFSSILINLGATPDIITCPASSRSHRHLWTCPIPWGLGPLLQVCIINKFKVYCLAFVCYLVFAGDLTEVWTFDWRMVVFNCILKHYQHL